VLRLPNREEDFGDVVAPCAFAWVDTFIFWYRAVSTRVVLISRSRNTPGTLVQQCPAVSGVGGPS